MADKPKHKFTKEERKLAKERSQAANQKRVDEGKAKFLTAFRRNHGLIALTCDEVKTPERTFYYWKQTDPEFAENIDWIMKVKKESYVKRYIDAMESDEKYENWTGLIFYMKTQLRWREEPVETDQQINLTVNYN